MTLLRGSTSISHAVALIMLPLLIDWSLSSFICINIATYLSTVELRNRESQIAIMVIEVRLAPVYYLCPVKFPCVGNPFLADDFKIYI